MALSMKKKAFLAASGLVLVFLGGCVVQYQLPSGEPRAKARFMTTTSGVKRVLVFANENCQKGEFGGQIAAVGGFGSSSEASQLNMYDPPEKSLRAKEREIQAGKRFYVAFSVDSPAATGLIPDAAYRSMGKCSVTLSFIPQPNRQYEVVHTFTDGKCGATVSELVNSRGGAVARVPEPTVKLYERQCSYSNLTH